MALDLGAIKIGIDVDNQQALKGLKDTDTAVANTEKQGNSKFASFASSAAKIGTVVAGAATAAATGLFELVKKTSDSASVWQDMSDRTNMSAEDLQQWGYVAQQCSVSSETLEKSIKTNQKTMIAAANGNKDAAAAYKTLGVNIYDANGKLRDSNDVYQEAVNKLADVKDANDRAALATTLFGKAGFQMGTMFQEGSQGIAALKKEAVDTGQVMSNEAVSGLESFGDSLAKLQGSFQGLINQIGIALLPAAQEIVDLLQNYLPQLEPIIQKIITTGLSLIQQLLPPVIQIVEKLLPIAVDIISQVFDAVQPLIPVILDLVDAFLPLIEAILEPLLPLLKPIISAFVDIAQQIIPPLSKVIGILTSEVLPPLISIFTQLVNLALKNVLSTFNNFKPVIDNVVEHIRLMVQFFKQIFSGDFAGAFNTMGSIAKNALDGLKNLFTGALNNVKDLFKNLKLAFPSIKLPHFEITYTTSGVIAEAFKTMGLKGIPKLSVDWYAQGGIFNQPSIIGVGEAGSEAVVPLDKLPEILAKAGAGGVTIQVQSMSVRNDNDIKQVAQELFKLQTSAQRARGIA